MATVNDGPSGGWDNPRWVGRWTIIGGIASVIALLIGLRACIGDSSNAETAAPPLVTSSPTTPVVIETIDPAPPTSTPSASPVNAAVPMLLADLEPVGGNTMGTEEVKGVQISGESYPRSVAEFCMDTESDLEYNLGRRAQSLTATIGIDDTQDAADLLVDVAIYGDNQLLESMTIVLGQAEEVDIPVENVLRLNLSCQTRHKDPGYMGMTYLSYGDATLIP